MAITVADQKAKHNQYRSEGDTIPWEAAGSEAIGDIVVIDSGTQTIGLVSSIEWDNQSDNAAAAGDHMELRITGIIDAAKAVGVLAPGDRVAWDGTDMSTNVTGGHMVIGDYASGDTRVHVKINMFPVAAT